MWSQLYPRCPSGCPPSLLPTGWQNCYWWPGLASPFGGRNLICQNGKQAPTLGSRLTCREHQKQKADGFALRNPCPQTRLSPADQLMLHGVEVPFCLYVHSAPGVGTGMSQAKGLLRWLVASFSWAEVYKVPLWTRSPPSSPRPHGEPSSSLSLCFLAPSPISVTSVGPDKPFCSTLFKMSGLHLFKFVFWYNSWRKILYHFSRFQEGEESPSHVPLCPLHVKEVLSRPPGRMQMHWFTAHSMPESFHIFINNASEHMQGGWYFLILSVTKLMYGVQVNTMVYRDWDFSPALWFLMSAFSPTTEPCWAHFAPGFLLHPLPPGFMLQDSSPHVSFVPWNMTPVKQPP